MALMPSKWTLRRWDTAPEHIAATSGEELANIPGITLSPLSESEKGHTLQERRARGEDVRPTVPLPEGYDAEVEWARWLSDSEELTRTVFDRCVRSGVFTLEDLSEIGNTEQLAEYLL